MVQRKSTHLKRDSIDRENLIDRHFEVASSNRNLIDRDSGMSAFSPERNLIDRTVGKTIPRRKVINRTIVESPAKGVEDRDEMGHKKERSMNSRSSKYPVMVSSRKGYDEPSKLKRVDELLELKYRAEAVEERVALLQRLRR
jgi:hypothetical protein